MQTLVISSNIFGVKHIDFTDELSISITDEKLEENINVIEISVMRQFQNVKYRIYMILNTLLGQGTFYSFRFIMIS